MTIQQFVEKLEEVLTTKYGYDRARAFTIAAVVEEMLKPAMDEWRAEGFRAGALTKENSG